MAQRSRRDVFQKSPAHNLQVKSNEKISVRKVVVVNNKPIVEVVSVTPPEDVHRVAGAALSLEFTDTLGDSPPRFIGRTNLEVAFMKVAESAAKGNLDALSLLLDRYIGRPKQSIETKKVVVDYVGYLKAKAEGEVPRVTDDAGDRLV